MVENTHTSGFVDGNMFHIMGHVVCGACNIYVGAALQQVVKNFQRTR